MNSDSLMPWGKHKGERISDVPASYLDWLIGQDWIDEWPDVKAYIEQNLDAIHEQVRRGKEQRS